jgi:hypothetical protein
VLAPAVAAGVRNAPWAAASPVAQHRLTAKDDRVRDVLDEGKPRYVLAVSYSMTPDFASVLTTIDASAYGPALLGGSNTWFRKPAWTDHIVIASDALILEPKTPADIEHAVARENARFATLGVDALKKKSRRGDADARQEANLLVRRHNAIKEEARMHAWTPLVMSVRRSELWSENQCARLHEALRANAAEATRVLGQLFAGRLGGTLPADWNEGETGGWLASASTSTRNRDGAAPTERRVFVEAPHHFVSRRAGDNVMVAYRYSWIPTAN